LHRSQQLIVVQTFHDGGKTQVGDQLPLAA
jgi:hypothetical protein